MRWLWLAFISLGGYGRVAFVSVLLLSAMRLRHARGSSYCFCLASGALFRLFCPRVLGFHRASWPLKALILSD